jgi:sporulation protein YlmC with PRC-barrel domain
MVKLISELQGAQIILFQENAKVGEVQEVVISPDDGAFLGITLIDPIEKKPKVIPAIEIKGFGSGLVLVKGLESLTEFDDVIKVKKALELGAKIIGERVETESGQNLGKVTDATINFELVALEKLYVSANPLLSFIAKDLLVPAKKIVEIQKKKIIVTDEFVKNTEAKVAPNVIPAVDN